MKFTINVLLSFVFVSVLFTAVLIDTWQFWAILFMWISKEMFSSRIK